MPTIVVSTKDVASVGMGKYLIDKYFKDTEKLFGDFPVYRYGKIDLIVIDTLHIYADWLEHEYPSDLYVFLSRHTSESGKPALTVHPTGNPADAMYGGISRTLSTAHAPVMLAILKNMKKIADSKGIDIDVTYEATHHGPTFATPVVFAEVGSTENEWRDQTLVSIAAESVIKGLSETPKYTDVAVGFGGGHYTPDFTRNALTRGIAFGHMLSKYSLEQADEHIILQALKKTYPEPSFAFLSSMKGDIRRFVKDVLTTVGVEIVD